MKLIFASMLLLMVSCIQIKEKPDTRVFPTPTTTVTPSPTTSPTTSPSLNPIPMPLPLPRDN